MDNFTGNMPIATISASLPSNQSSMTSVEQSRAIAEIQAAMAIAQRFPRDETAAHLKIIKNCKRLSFAESAGYSLKRGGQIVSGPSIRMAEMMAANWGNLFYGFKELSRTNDSSEVEAYCWDLETNVKSVRSFTVKHIRDKNTGNVALTSERDKYELIANMAQRRVRACIFEIIPGDIKEDAERKCAETIKAGDGSQTMEQRIKSMVVAFDELGVTLEMIEGFLQHKITAIDPNEFVRLQKIYRSIRDGVAPREDFFSVKKESKIDITALSEKSDTSIYGTKPTKEEPTPQTQEGPSDHDKALIRLYELASVNQHLVDKHLAGRNPDNMSADEIYGVIDAVEDGMR